MICQKICKLSVKYILRLLQDKTDTSTICSRRSSDSICLPTSTSKEIEADYFSFYASQPPTTSTPNYNSGTSNNI